MIHYLRLQRPPIFQSLRKQRQNPIFLPQFHFNNLNTHHTRILKALQNGLEGENYSNLFEETILKYFYNLPGILKILKFGITTKALNISMRVLCQIFLGNLKDA